MSEHRIEDVAKINQITQQVMNVLMTSDVDFSKYPAILGAVAASLIQFSKSEIKDVPDEIHFNAFMRGVFEGAKNTSVTLIDATKK